MKIISLCALAIIIVCSIYLKKSKMETIPSFGYGFVSSMIKNAKGEIPNFSFLDQSGKFHELYRYGDASAVVFLSENSKCPLSEKDKKEYLDLIEKFKGNKVEFFILDSSEKEDRGREHEKIVRLMDTSQIFSNYLNIKSSKTITVLSTDNWSINYQGTFDINNNKIFEALSKTIKKIDFKEIEKSEKSCSILIEKKYKKQNPDYVASIFTKKCIVCHGESGSYLPKLNGESRLEKWREMAKETILTERMPPSGVDHFYESIEDDLKLSIDEKRTLVTWLEDKNRVKISDSKLQTPINKSDPYKNLSKVYSVKMSKPLEISPGGTLEYIYTQVGEASPRDMWLNAVEYKSKTQKQIHHAAIHFTSKPLVFYEEIVAEYLKKPNIKKPNYENLTDENKYPYLVFAINKYEKKYNNSSTRLQISAAGKKQPVVFNPETFVFVPKGSYVILESHFMGTGKEEVEQATIDFFEEKIKKKSMKQLKGTGLFSLNIKIPANTDNFVVKTNEWVVPKKIKLLNILSHMHMRGKAIKVIKTDPNGVEKIILSIPNYNYGWNVGSEVAFKKPLVIEVGSKIKAECIFDNSIRSPYNPEPNRVIYWGQRLDRSEMCNFGLSFYGI